MCAAGLWRGPGRRAGTADHARRIREPGAVAASAGSTGRATDPEQLGEQLALLLDGAAPRTRVLNADAIAAVLIDNAIPVPAEG